MPVPAIAIHEGGPSVDIARAMDANFSDSKQYDRVVTRAFDWTVWFLVPVTRDREICTGF